MYAQRTRQRGAALVVGLLLLTILTLLAIAGMNTASTELVMAGNEQFRENAFQAAETGVERKIAGLNNMKPYADPITEIAALQTNNTVETVVTYRGVGPVQNYGNNFVGYHFEVRSTGQSARNASATHVQGAYYVNQVGEGDQSPLDPLNPDLTAGAAAGP